MWKILRKIVLIFTIVTGLFLCANYTWYKFFNHSRLVAFEVYDAIALAGQETDYTALVLGDSVARQIYNPKYQDETEQYAYMATNQAITPAGNYLLLRKFHENNPQLQDVYYIARPDSFFADANFIFTYSYLITPLYNESFKYYLKDDTCLKLEQTFGRLFSTKEFPKWLLAKYPKLLELYQNNRSTAQAKNLRGGNSPSTEYLSIPYLQEMQKYCAQNGITLHLLFAPIPENYTFNTDDFLFLKEDGDNSIYNNLMASLYYIDENEFVDDIHMEKDYIANNRLKLKSHYN